VYIKKDNYIFTLTKKISIMKTVNVLEAIANDVQIQKASKKMKCPMTNDEFLSTAQNYINAIREGRMLCIIPKVSSSGMSRQIKFHSFEINTKPLNRESVGYYCQYWSFFKMLGYSEARNGDAFTIGGCGMDMIFHTNYTIIHKLTRLGMLTEDECKTLAQMTPTVL